MLDLIGLDADDTLWHNEPLYAASQGLLRELLTPYADPETVGRRLYETEMRNLDRYGYGIKSFALSMIETAILVSNGAISGDQVIQLIRAAQDMLAAPVELLPGVAETIRTLASTHPLVLITKGDLKDQRDKVARSGLAPYLHHVEVVSDKSQGTYRALLERLDVAPARFLMVGNSLRSDVLPVIALGGRAVHIPYHMTWEHEDIDPPPAHEVCYHQLEEFGQLPALIRQIDRLAHPGRTP